MTQHKSDKKMTFAEKVAESISKNRIALWIVLIILVVLTVVFAVVDMKIKDTNNMYSNKAVELQNEFQDWFSAQEEDKEAAEKIFLDNVSPIADSEKTSILVEKALFIRGQYYMQKEEWGNADADFSKIAENSSDSYLASVSLYNSASAKENEGEIESALKTLLIITENYRSNSPIIPEALFNLGRLNESLDRKAAALESYEELVSSYSSSNWTNLAKTRIISLKASGVSQ